MVNGPCIVHAPDAPPVNGHYSHAVVHNGTVYVSGQLGRGPHMSDDEAGDIEVQVRRSWSSVAAILRAAGSDLSQLLRVTLYIPDVALWPKVNAVYEEMLADHRPARSIVPTRELHFGALIEIEAIAAVSPAQAGPLTP